MDFTGFDFFIFDVNGVLINSNLANASAMAEAFTDAPNVRKRICEVYMHLTGIDRGSKIRCIQQEVIRRPFKDGEFELRWNRFRRLSGDAMLEVARTPGCTTLLDELGKRGKTRVALSNTPLEELSRCLAVHDMAHRLDIVRGGGDWSKTESLCRLMDEFHPVPSRCLMIGDGRGDLAAARHSGIAFAAIDPATGEFDEETGFHGPYASLAHLARDEFGIRTEMST